MGKKIELPIVLNIILLVLFVLLISLVSVKYYAQVYRLISEPEHFKTMLLSYGQASILIFILFQVLQVVIATIPGEFVQIAGGYVYGTLAGTLYSALGIMLGYLIVFSITRLIGYPLVKIFIAENKIEKLKGLIQTKKSVFLLFFLFLVPGIPKDFLVYAAGLTPIEPVKFLIIVALARFPALLGASFIGANIGQKNYLIVAITFGISILLFIFGFMVKDKIILMNEKRHDDKEQQRSDNG